MLDHVYFKIGVNTLPAQGELSVLFSGQAKPLPSHQIGPAVHDYYLVHTVMSGYGTFEIEGKRYDCKQGDTFIIFPEVLFTYAADRTSPWSYRWVAFKGPLAQPLLGRIGITPSEPVVCVRNLRTVTRLYRDLERAFQGSDYPELSDLEASGLLRLLLKEFGSDNTEKLAFDTLETVPDIERQIQQAIRLLSLQYAQPVSIEDLSRTLGYHRMHLSRMFKQATGLSPMKFLLKIRMERAVDLLTGSSHLSIDHIASSIGYADPSYFSKQFRKCFGVSPTEYRLNQQMLCPAHNHS
ncbi:AraC family transcriptional regulator [Paenibacillus spongiae]|uniref:AraC family transcriptional regulator n=1 Tax=Paenibacillus spongiae TaxID=2909671 RepID=A0ABY5S2X4_9BACL|nr:AraC family transcriptional regulator [Paenibacillus spongiae]UVI28222.1 AraC family transcriptional regulator [Paenibacillus spongiae]